MTEEIWKPIPEYEGIYEASSEGRIRVLDRVVTSDRWYGHTVFTKRGLVLKQKQAKSGYMNIGLTKDGKQRTYRVHRLVMAAFHGPSDLQVNHINKVRNDNRLENLEYLTCRENIRYSSCRPVEQYDLATGETIKRYESGADVKEDGFDASAVGHCCHGDKSYYSHHGYGWRFAS